MTETQILQRVMKSSGERGGRYLIFELDSEEYGIEILRVREIIGMMDIVAVPLTPIFMKGFINLRGTVIPITDLRLKFDLPETETTDETCIIVVDINGIEMGIIVDKLFEVLDIKNYQIEDAPSLGSLVDTEFILGIANIDERVSVLLDIEKVLIEKEINIYGLA